MMSTAPLRRLVFLLAFALTVAMPGAVRSEPRVFFGTPVPNADQSGMVMVFPSGGGYCSGALVANDWVITAAHCGVTLGTVTDNQVYLGNQSGPFQYSRADYAVQPPSLDFALLHLQQAFELDGSRSRYRVSPYPGSSFSLLGLAETFYGYSYTDLVGPGTLHSAQVIGAGPFGAHNHGVTSMSGQYSVPGDSGGPLILEAAGIRALTGINKCGFTECLARPETFRDWIYAQLYDRPMPFPNVWFLPYSSHPNFGAAPLENSYANSATFTPCPDAATYEWSATYDLEPVFDFITVTTGLGPTVLNGQGTIAVTGAGAMTVDVSTDSSVRSPGLLALPITCGTGVRFADPAPMTQVQTAVYKTKWDPCPGGRPLTWSATYDLGVDGKAKIDKTVLTGAGTIANVFAKKKINVKVETGSMPNPGIQKLTARCTAALQCHGVDCFTLPATLPPDSKLKNKWTPCNGGAFSWQADYDVGAGTLAIKGKQQKTVLTGAGRTAWTRGSSTLTVQLKTDETSPTRGLPELKAMCDAWGTPPPTGIQLVEASYGRNCNAYYGNVTYGAASACNGLAGCAYVIPSVTPDPAPGCAKDFVADYTCDADALVKQVSIAGESAGAVATFTCP